MIEKAFCFQFPIPKYFSLTQLNTFSKNLTLAWNFSNFHSLERLYLLWLSQRSILASFWPHTYSKYWTYSFKSSVLHVGKRDELTSSWMSLSLKSSAAISVSFRQLKSNGLECFALRFLRQRSARLILDSW
jgi:hypothetical protein